MKKWLVLLLTLALGLLGLAGCGSSDTSGDAKDGKVEITYGFWDKKQVPAVDEIIKLFNQKYPNIKVKTELTPYAQYFQKLETAATGGALPDVLWMNGPHIVQYAEGKVIVPLSDLASKDNYSLDNYPKSLVDLYTVDGKLYGIPKDFDTTGLWYNKKIFDEAGIPYPDNTWDWNKLKEVAKKLTNKDKGVYGFAALMGNQGGYYDFIWQNGGHIISDDGKSVGFDQPEAIEALKYNISFIKEGLSPTQAQMTETAPSELFSSGKIAMMFDGPWMVPEYKKNPDLNVAVVPKGKQRAVAIHGLANVIAANTKHKDAAWKFVQFLGSKEAAEVYAKTGTVIPAYNGTQDAWLKAVPNLNLQAFIDGVDYSVPLPSVKNTGEIWQYETDILKKAWSNEESVEDAAKELTKKADEALAKN
ncbi:MULTISPECIES: sugar ABC transporter substrate-binding protein [unclassified Bacillus (in: firmicutes)]|uniref:ABC transporter substrate-binding protein n=1 Tax=unclassified Bacillus (in: firmicutes) TaxID=185979 RepID=UPI0008F0DBC4|nr:MULTISPECIES: sugar ABC transporter substrate-binding protein [unclassified Bacillus (in: firmicutes)]PGZ94519.1 sugar ABC transporter substrate-binding protein [Bacillus sp. AFS029533]SFD80372.1 multiple sugar transport system substrate-binding protein [Bacillus sp. UNCCL81]